MNKTHDFEVGDILSSSWGYEQTNVDFFEVVKITSKMVHLVQLESVRDYAGQMHGKCIPGKRLEGKPFVRKVTGGTVKIESYAYARKWSGAPVGFSSYA